MRADDKTPETDVAAPGDCWTPNFDEPARLMTDLPFGLVGAPPVPFSLEDSHSGLVRTIGNRVGCYSPRGFKSRILRHDDQQQRWIP